MPANNRNGLATIVAGVAVVSVLVLLAMTSPGPASRPLVVYCAHDSVFSDAILKKFSEETGIQVDVRFDTEATKALSLVNLIVEEKNNPRCDVFWNNEVLGTLDLQDQEILLPYKGAGYNRIPAQFKDPGGAWTGFAARLRVYIVNKDKVDEPAHLLSGGPVGDLSRVAIAKPLYGTTRTHFTVLWKERGGEGLKNWYRDVLSRGLKEVGGNAEVMKLVASRACDYGWTDTDDYFAAYDDDKPVVMLPIGVDTKAMTRPQDGKVILIPNSVSIIRGTQKLTEAQRLVEFLLSERIEVALANSASRQIPLGPVSEAETRLNSEVRELAAYVPSGYDLNSLGTARKECLDWLKSENLQ